MPPSAWMTAPPPCLTSALFGLELSEASVLAAASYSFVVVTFINAAGATLAQSWMRQLRSLRLKALVGLTSQLPAEAQRRLASDGATLFCADGALARLKTMAAYEELANVVAVAARLGLDVVASDADVGWIANPLPHLRAVRAYHPSVDLLLASDRVTNRLSTTALTAADGQAAGLELEDAMAARLPALNVGFIVLFLRPNAAALLVMLRAWAEASLTPAGLRATRPRGPFPFWATAAKSLGRRRRAAAARLTEDMIEHWPQGPINERVIGSGIARHPTDPRLARNAGNVTIGVLPSLQYTTALVT